MAAALTATAAVAPAVPASAASCSNPGQPVNVGTHDNYLQGLALVAPCNVWAVGFFNNGTANQTLVERWKDGSWTHVASPNPGGSKRPDELYGVATSGSNAWAVGDTSTGAALETLVLRSNGTAWTRVPSPNPGGHARRNVLYAVTALSGSNAWAVGYFFDGTAFQTLVLHWDGGSWKRVPSPNPGGHAENDVLFGIAAISSSNAWAVGYTADGTLHQTLVLHWDGSAWKRVPSPSPGGPHHHDYLEGVSATSASNAWAVGDFSGAETPNQTLVERWNGTAWKIVPSPDPGGSDQLNTLNGVSATSATDVWAAGYYEGSTSDQTLLLRWNGSSWKQMPSPNPAGSVHLALVEVVGIAATSAWAVGSWTDNSVSRTLAARCC